MELKNIGTVIAVREFDHKDGHKVRYSIGAPVPFPNGSGYFCPYQVQGIGADLISYSGGVDSMQALLLTLKAIAVDLKFLPEESKSQITWEAAERPDDFGFSVIRTEKSDTN